MASSKAATEHPDIPEEIVLDGILYAFLAHKGADWRIGSVNAAWRSEIAAWPSPDTSALATLASRGIWPNPACPPAPLAVMCCGLGAVWPGMGAGLYDNFPAARLAMDRIASLAAWDVLALMDESGLEKISRTRWQIPYLFMLEYAQWSQFLSLGLSPAMLCGHSLGELVALCLAGVYSLEAAWHLLETRAKHMTELEASATRESGMLAVPAGEEIIKAVLAEFPDLRISNSNTPRQYILGGPLESLREVRKRLRHRRIPAIMLNMGIAFHNPAMRILRDISERRLNGLDMHAPRIPMLSCVTTGFYPKTRPEICSYITDLDENTVEWTGLVRAMRQKYGIECFLELGPQETLCGLVRENDDTAACVPSGGKNREVAAMREACARLYALGHLPRQTIWNQKLSRPREAPPTFRTEQGTEVDPTHANPYRGLDSNTVETILELIAGACRASREALSPQMDLRHDLALRSSNFPYLVQEAEKRLGIQIALENLFQIATVRDLVYFLAGKDSNGDAARANAQASARAAFFAARNAPLVRLRPPVEADGKLQPAPLDPNAPGIRWQKNALFILCAFDAALLPGIWSGFAPLGGRVAVPRDLLPLCAPLVEAGSQMLPLDCGLDAQRDEIFAAIEQLIAKEGAPAGIFFAAPAVDTTRAQAAPTVDLALNLVKYLPSPCGNCNAQPWFCLFQRFLVQRDQSLDTSTTINVSTNMHAFLAPFRSAATRGKCPTPHVICWLDDREEHEQRNQHEAGDMLTMEILHGSESFIIWKKWQKDSSFPERYCPASHALYPIFTDLHPPFAPQAGRLQALCQFSNYATPTLETHGGCAKEGEASSPGAPWLPIAAMLDAAAHAAWLLAPWLKVTGFSDMRIFSFPRIPAGIPRECRIDAALKPWLMLEGVFTRMCGASLAARELAPNGRHTQTYGEVCDLICFLSAKASSLPAIWPVGKEDDKVPWVQAGQDIFYNSLGFCGIWKMLSAWRRMPDGRSKPELEFLLKAPAIAKGKIWEYSQIAYLVESAVLGALEAIVLEECGEKFLDARAVGECLRKWNLTAIGFIRFAADLDIFHGCGELKLQLRRSWRNERLMRFDAQIASRNGMPLLTIYHIEFDRT